MFQRINLPRSGGGGLELRPFNFFENWAWQLWSPLAMRGQPRPFFSLTHGKPFTRENGRHVHLFIVGFGLMGQAIAAHTARIAHFANGQKTRITVIDSQLDWWRDVFRSHCFVERVPDLSLEFLALPADRRPRVVWLQSGIRHDEAAARLTAAGIDVVQDACLGIYGSRYLPPPAG